MNTKQAGALIMVLMLSAAFPRHLSAQGFNYSENFDYFGRQLNWGPPQQPAGICAAVAAINSFIFLENQYPLVYGAPNTGLLTPHYNSANTNDTTDSLNFACTGWKVDAKPQRQGYYNRGGTAGGDYVATLTDWFNDYAPATTTIDSWYTGSAQHNMNPPILSLAQEIQDNENVEFFVLGTLNPDFNHALTLTGVSCSDAGTYTISWQDPNDPTNSGYNSIATFDINGQWQITGVPGANGPADIYAAFSESPVPEPSSLALLTLSVLGLLGCRQRRAI